MLRMHKLLIMHGGNRINILSRGNEQIIVSSAVIFISLLYPEAGTAIFCIQKDNVLKYIEYPLIATEASVVQLIIYVIIQMFSSAPLRYVVNKKFVNWFNKSVAR